jgi:hypothetical protein
MKTRASEYPQFLKLPSSFGKYICMNSWSSPIFFFPRTPFDTSPPLKQFLKVLSIHLNWGARVNSFDPL